MQGVLPAEEVGDVVEELCSGGDRGEEGVFDTLWNGRRECPAIAKHPQYRDPQHHCLHKEGGPPEKAKVHQARQNKDSDADPKGCSACTQVFPTQQPDRVLEVCLHLGQPIRHSVHHREKRPFCENVSWIKSCCVLCAVGEGGRGGAVLAEYVYVVLFVLCTFVLFDVLFGAQIRTL